MERIYLSSGLGVPGNPHGGAGVGGQGEGGLGISASTKWKKIDGWMDCKGNIFGKQGTLEKRLFLKGSATHKGESNENLFFFFLFFWHSFFFFFFTGKYHESAKFFHIIPISRKDYFSCMCSH